MKTRLVWMASLALLSGCSDIPLAVKLLEVRTDRTTYTDTSTMIVTVKLLGGGPVTIGGCPPPALSIADSTGVGMYGGWAGASSYFGICDTSPTPATFIRLKAGDSATVAVPLTGFAPGTYRVMVQFDPGGHDIWVNGSNSFVVR